MTQDNIILIPIGSANFERAAAYAKQAELGGTSQIRSAKDRQRKLQQDQLVGQLGQMAFCLYLTGNSNMYRLSRYWVNIDPSRGDGGSDFPGANVDVKTSKVSADRIDDLLNYNLVVRTKERHARSVYVLAFAIDQGDRWTVALVGWASDKDLPQESTTDARFPPNINGEAFLIRADKLNPLMPLEWFY